MEGIRSMFERPEILCENCLGSFEFEKSDIHGYVDGEYELFVTCPYCEEEIEVQVEDYGFWPEDLIGDNYGVGPEDDG